VAVSKGMVFGDLMVYFARSVANAEHVMVMELYV